MGFLSGGFIYVVPFLVVLTVLVFVHEMGHYLIARRNGVRIEIFSIGFGPELIGRYDRNGTRWRLSVLPFGGYVKMFGDADAASTPGSNLDTMSAEERAVAFHHQSLGARAAILAGGPGANFLFAIALMAGLFMTVGQPFSPPKVEQVQEGSAAAAAGMRAGDVVLSIDGHAIDRFEALQQAVKLNVGTPMHLVVQRGTEQVPVTVTPKVTETVDHFGNHHRFGLLGIARGAATYIRRDPGTAVVQAVRETWSMTADTLQAIGQMISGARTTEDLGGPLRIAKLSGDVAQGGFLSLLSFMAVLSVNLGLINLFPIPVLDGGHLLFYAAEALRGRPLGPKAQEFGFRVGLALVLTLMVFATWNDLVQMHVFAFLKSLVT